MKLETASLAKIKENERKRKAAALKDRLSVWKPYQIARGLRECEGSIPFIPQFNSSFTQGDHAAGHQDNQSPLSVPHGFGSSDALMIPAQAAMW